MAERSTVARPYAEAAFRLAREHRTQESWGRLLALLAVLARYEPLTAVIEDPRYPQSQLYALLLAVVEKLDGGLIAGQAGNGQDSTGSPSAGLPREWVQNWLALLLAEYRFALAPEIARIFEEALQAYSNAIHARLESAFPISPAQSGEIAALLERQLGKRIETETAVDQKLLGGVRIVLGDQVIDASMRGRLTRLETLLA